MLTNNFIWLFTNAKIYAILKMKNILGVINNGLE